MQAGPDSRGAEGWRVWKDVPGCVGRAGAVGEFGGRKRSGRRRIKTETIEKKERLREGKGRAGQGRRGGRGEEGRERERVVRVEE